MWLVRVIVLMGGLVPLVYGIYYDEPAIIAAAAFLLAMASEMFPSRYPDVLKKVPNVVDTQQLIRDKYLAGKIDLNEYERRVKI